jgi:hypothetical protein
VTPNSYGVTGGYGGFGGFGQTKMHERRNGVSFGSRQFSRSKHVNITIKGWAPRSHRPMKMGQAGGRHHGGMSGGGGPKHVAFVGKGSGGKPRGMGHGRGHH